MAYVGAFIHHINDPELCLITGKVKVGSRVRLVRWSTGIVRTAKGSDVTVIPLQEAVERLRTLIVADTPSGSFHAREGQDELLTAAYAYVMSFDPELPAMTSVPTPVCPQTPICKQTPKALPPGTRSSSPAVVPPHKTDFIREAVIAEIVASNLMEDDEGRIGVWGTKVDLYRLIQVYCATAGIDAPTKSLVLRRIGDITSFLALAESQRVPGADFQQCGYAASMLRLDIEGMEP